MTTEQYLDAITGKTAAEIVYESADHTKEHMGLTTWKYDILKDNGKISHQQALEKAYGEYDRKITQTLPYYDVFMII